MCFVCRFCLGFSRRCFEELFLTIFPRGGPSETTWHACGVCACVCVCARGVVRARVDACVRVSVRGRQGVMIMIWQQWEGTATTVAGPSTSPPLHTAAKCYG